MRRIVGKDGIRYDKGEATGSGEALTWEEWREREREFVRFMEALLALIEEGSRQPAGWLPSEGKVRTPTGHPDTLDLGR